MTANSPKTREDVVFRPLADEWVLFDPRRHRLHVLNLTAALVWTHCDGETSLDDMVAELESAFAEPPQRADLVRDVEQVLQRFRNEELLA